MYIKAVLSSSPVRGALRVQRHAAQVVSTVRGGFTVQDFVKKFYMHEMN